MIVRTPPTKRPRAEAKSEESPRVGSERGLIIFEDLQPPAPPPLPESSSSHPMLCTYQCRQMVKADFLDALSNAEKQVVEYQSKFEELNGNLSKAEAERKRLRDQLLYAEQELAAVKRREQALQDQLLKEINDSRERLKKQLESCSNLEIKLENERKLREKAETSAASAEEKATVLEEKLGSLSDTIEREKKRLNMELLHVQQESKFSISKIRGDLERMECRANNAEKESKLFNSQLEKMKTQLKQCLNEKSELEQKLLSFVCHEGSSTEDNILIKHLQDELRKCEFEVREARKLKSSHENVALIKEKLLEEKSRRERVESELSQLREIELKMKKLEDELASWKLIMNDIPGVLCPDDVSIKFAALQKELINNMMKMGEANARVKELLVALDDAQLCKQNAESESALVKEKAEGLKLEVNKLEHMISRITEERDRLRKVVDDLKRSNNDQPRAVIADEGHLQELESSLANKEGCIKQLESDIHEAKEVNNRQLLEIELLNGRLNNEARRLKSLERENDQLRSEISLLESKLGHGDFSAANTKVLRMVNTLALESEAKLTIEALKTELQKTKEKLQAVEELKSQPGDAGQLVDSNISTKIMQLKEQIATLEKREERYKTVFADRISVFRRACCELFGYKIVMDEHQRSNGIPVTHFTLQSIYAQSDNEKLEFEYESGTTNILTNEYTSQPEISHQVDIFVRKMNSIPAFTANLTVESFNKRTLS